MNKELNLEQHEEFIPQAIETLVEDVLVQDELEAAPVFEVEHKKAPKVVETKKEAVKELKATKIIQHQPSTYMLLMEDGTKLKVKKRNYNKHTKVVTL